jgi:hypothetical protein
VSRHIVANGHTIKRSQIKEMKKQGARITLGHHDRRVSYWDPDCLRSRAIKRQFGTKEQTNG